MNKETREQIEREADYFIKAKLSEDTPTTGQYHWTSYVAGATAQHPKAWNAAIEAAIAKTELVINPNSKTLLNFIRLELEALKLDPNQA